METLVPFIPTDADLKNPLARRYMEEAGYLTNLRGSDPHGASGSNWTDKEVHVVRAIPLVNVHSERMIPKEYFPTEDNPDLRAASIDDIREFQADKFSGNTYQLLFDILSKLSVTKTSEAEILNNLQQSDSSSSDLSTSSTENSAENTSTDALKMYLGMVEENEDMSLNVYGTPTRFIWHIAGMKFEATNDGNIGVNYRGRYSRSDRNSKTPAVGFECKVRHAAGVKRGSGEAEDFLASVFRQEVAQLIGGLISQRRMLIRHPDQELFVIGMHGTVLYFSAAYFPPEYIRYLEMDHSANAYGPATIFLWVRRSRHFDFKSTEDRVQALKFLWALITYIASGTARVNIVFSALRVARN
ncbi:hypothetical protein BDV25DRAFT_134420 [Aspergillus avenaceus]|uniref:Uncharacterized protein n=1 Tax=Aspergillus avenaceus TaxID=36643 RepID=A0A5N6TEP1_ASPAV|nr:hypothetical protein BDV25DRAFT_134420 [Aspergillus avenaceus]